MHPYSTDGGERYLVLTLFVLPSILLAWALTRVNGTIGIPHLWLVEQPSVLGFYGLLYNAFNRWFWKCSFFHRLGLTSVPDLSGTWSGHICSSHNAHATELPGTLIIQQRWTVISIRFLGHFSGSKSTMAAVLTQSPDAPLLSYEYVNEPRSDALPTMEMHRGTARLTWHQTSDSLILEGDYYTGRGRLTHGTMRFVRQADQ